MVTHSDRVRSTIGPVDRVAARVMQGGVHYEKELPEHLKHWKAPPPFYRFKPQPGNPQSIDMTGTRFGLFTVVGWLGSSTGPTLGKSGKRMGLWLVRCTCGDYEARTARAIRNAANSADRCHICRDVQYKRENATEAARWADRKASTGK